MPERRLFVFVAVLLILLLVRCAFFFKYQPNLIDGQELKIEITLSQEPKITGRLQQFSASLPGRKVFVSAPLYPQYKQGDTLLINGKLLTAQTPNGEFYTLRFPAIQKVEDTSFFAETNQFFAGVRRYISQFFSSYLSPTHAALLIGIVFGIKEPMQKAFSEALQSVGLVHIIAASGMNVTLVAGLLSSVTVVFLPRKIALVVALSGVLFFAVLSGLEPSIVRAAIMAIFTFSAQILGRQRLASYSLFLAAFLMLFFDPALLFSLGFQLSFLATAGLLYIRPVFESSKKIKNVLNKSIIGEDFITTFAAQLATAPILIAYFGSFSLWSLLVNVLVLWTVPILMILGAVAVIVSLFSNVLGGLVLYLTIPFLSFIQGIVTFFGQHTQPLQFEYFPWQFVVGYYCLLVAGLLFVRKREK